jgi:hypothetical protein
MLLIIYYWQNTKMYSEIFVILKQFQFPQVTELQLFVFTSELRINMLKCSTLCKLSVKEKLCVIIDLLQLL